MAATVSAAVAVDADAVEQQQQSLSSDAVAVEQCGCCRWCSCCQCGCCWCNCYRCSQCCWYGIQCCGGWREIYDNPNPRCTGTGTGWCVYGGRHISSLLLGSRPCAIYGCVAESQCYTTMYSSIPNSVKGRRIMSPPVPQSCRYTMSYCCLLLLKMSASGQSWPTSDWTRSISIVWWSKMCHMRRTKNLTTRYGGLFLLFIHL